MGKKLICEEKMIAIIFIIIIFSTLIFTITTNFQEIKDQLKTIYRNQQLSKYEKVMELTKQSETILNDNINNKMAYIDTYGLIQKIIGRKNVEDSNDETKKIVKMKNGMITFTQQKQDMEVRANKISKLNEELQKNGIKLIYIQAPYKVRSEDDLPVGIIDYGNENADILLEGLEEKNVKTIDLRSYFSNLNTEEEFFITDHHWRPQTGFNGVKYLTEILNKEYEFGLDPFFTNIDNYNKIKKEKSFLGSIGKRIGKYYAGVDDFEYILPNFETKLLVENKITETKLEGTFEETIIKKDFLESDDITQNRYACYLGGDYPEIIIKNEKSKSDKKILVMQDSFGLAFSSFLSLSTSELRILDLRHFEDNEIQYIKDYNPDVVILIYNPSSFYIEKNFDFK